MSGKQTAEAKSHHYSAAKKASLEEKSRKGSEGITDEAEEC